MWHGWGNYGGFSHMIGTHLEYRLSDDDIQIVTL
jgi:hypothetical protein